MIASLETFDDCPTTLRSAISKGMMKFFALLVPHQVLQEELLSSSLTHYVLQYRRLIPIMYRVLVDGTTHTKRLETRQVEKPGYLLSNGERDPSISLCR